jgi:Zn-dependent metalloprotease
MREGAMNRCSFSGCCFLPPHVVDHLAASDNPQFRRAALRTAQAAAAAREHRVMFASMPGMAAIPSMTAGLERRVYTMSSAEQPLPGLLVRREADSAPTGDAAADEAFDYSGATYDYYRTALNRNSLDDRGMTLISSVHYGEEVDNAFWNGEQMLYGDGDGLLFGRFTASLDVVGHELTHGVVQFTANLDYLDEPGALNEHFADVFGVLVRFAAKEQDPTDPLNWWLGGDLFRPGTGVRGIRTFTADKAYVDHPELGTDPQPKHYRDKYAGTLDFGGVHINSGIPNHAFYRTVQALGSEALKKAGRIWYDTLKSLTQFSEFQEAAARSVQAAVALFGYGSLEQQAVASGWQAVGIDPRVEPMGLS